MVLSRSYTCKGSARVVNSPAILRVRSDAPVMEIGGVLVNNPGNTAIQTLIVDGQRVPPKILGGARRGASGGYVSGCVRIDFGSRRMRDVWIQTTVYPAFLRVGSGDLIVPPEAAAEPQLTAVGDSYLKSVSGQFCDDGPIALELAARLGIRNVAVDTLNGTGYWNSGVDAGNLNDRLAAHAADRSTIYLVMAGINDYVDIINPPQSVWPSRDRYEQSVTAYLSGLRAAQPDALIVVTAPFCPIAPLSDSAYVAHAETNTSGVGDFLYKAQVQKQAVQKLAGPWVYIDVLTGGGWLSSAGASGDVTGLQWFTGGTPAPGTNATNKPGNAVGGGGGGFGGIDRIPVLAGGLYTQSPDISATGGSGSGLLLSSRIDATGRLVEIKVVCPGQGYTAASGLPVITVDAAYEVEPASAGLPVLMTGINAGGAYPLPSFAPSGSTDLNNIYSLLLPDLIHPSPPGVSHLSRRLAQNIHDAVLAF